MAGSAGLSAQLWLSSAMSVPCGVYLPYRHMPSIRRDIKVKSNLRLILYQHQSRGQRCSDWARPTDAGGDHRSGTLSHMISSLGE